MIAAQGGIFGWVAQSQDLLTALGGEVSTAMATVSEGV
jgi:hypothetical protein